MPRIIVTVKIVPEGATEPALTWDIDEATVLELAGALFKVPRPALAATEPNALLPTQTAPIPGTPSVRAIDYVDRAFAKIGKPSSTIHEILEHMLADGWTTKSKNPVGVVATSMRGKGYVYSGDGWSRASKPPRPHSIRTSPKQVGPGLRKMIEAYLRQHGPASLSQIEAAILRDYPGAFKPVSIGLAARSLVGKERIRKTGDLYSAVTQATNASANGS